eukprot:4039661-Ditylum_brightwellii.AAC.1
MCLPPTPVSQGHLQMQQNMRHCYPEQGQAGTYINDGIGCHADASYPRMSNHVPMRKVDSFHFNKVDENKNFDISNTFLALPHTIFAIEDEQCKTESKTLNY